MKTLGDVLRQSLRLAKVLDHSEEMDAEMFTTSRQALEDMLHDWQTEWGIDWIERDAVLRLEPGRAHYFFGPEGDFPHYVTDIPTHVINDGYNDVTIYKVGRQDYRDKPNKATLGRPTEFAMSEFANGRDVYFWPTPDCEYLFNFSYRGLLDIPTNPDEVLAIPVSFDRCIRYNLAMDLMALYGVMDSKVDQLAIALKQKQLEKSNETGTVNFVKSRRR